MKFAVASRLMHFQSGPARMRFYACQEHRADLERGDFELVWSPIEPVREEDERDEIDCDLCREG